MNFTESVNYILENSPSSDKESIKQLLTVEGDQLQKLFLRAREVREKVCGNKIFLYGFVYFSTFCKNECNFCYYRNSNKIDRYRKTPEQIIETAIGLAQSGVNLIDLTMGEDLYYTSDFKPIIDIVKTIKSETGLPVMISPGLLSKNQIRDFIDANIDWYALYQETHNRNLFKNLRSKQSYNDRMEAKLYAKRKGILIEEGILVGVGESIDDIVDSIVEMGQIGAKQLRVMSFVPQEGSPMENYETPNRNLELRIIAILRILYPDVLIPASLDVDGISGLKARINAGANVVTSIIPPNAGLAGVANESMDVDSGGRTVLEVVRILNDMGLESGSAEEYIRFMGKYNE